MKIAITLFAMLLLLFCTLQPGAAKKKSKAQKTKKNETKAEATQSNKKRGEADARRYWDKSGDGSDGRDYWGMPNPNPGWDKYYEGKCDEMLACAAQNNLKCLQESAIPLCNLQMQQTNGDRNIFAQALGVAAEAGNLEAVKLMVNFPTRWWNKDMVVNAAGETVLMHAAAHGEHEVMEWLLREGADVRMRSPNGETAEDLARTSPAPGEALAVLQQSSADATQSMLKQLATGRALSDAEFNKVMAAGAVVNTVENSTGLTAVALAAKFGMAEVVKMLAANGADLDWRDPARGHCVIHMACDNGHFNALVTLLEYGADPSAVTDHFEMDCLQLAAMNGRNGIVHAMLDHGSKYPERKADPKRTSYNGETALLMFARQMYGVVGAQAQIMKLLIDAGSDVNVKSADSAKLSPIFYSIDHNQAEAMEMLVEAGADTKSVAVDDKDGGRPIGAFEQSVRSGCQPCAAWLIQNKHREEFQFTRQRSGLRGITALYSVVLQGWEDVAAALLKDGFDPNAPNVDMSTPLFAAAQRGSKAMIELLLDSGANVEARNGNYETPLIAAAVAGRTAAIKALIAGGADVNAQGKDQGTALFQVASRGYVDCARELLLSAANKELQGYGKPSHGGRGGRAGVVTLMTPAVVATKNGFAKVAKLIDGWTPIEKTEDADLL